MKNSQSHPWPPQWSSLHPHTRIHHRSRMLPNERKQRALPPVSRELNRMKETELRMEGLLTRFAGRIDGIDKACLRHRVSVFYQQFYARRAFDCPSGVQIIGRRTASDLAEVKLMWVDPLVAYKFVFRGSLSPQLPFSSFVWPAQSLSLPFS